MNMGKDPQELQNVLAKLPNKISNLDYNIADHLAGPLQDKKLYPNGWMDVFMDFRRSEIKGQNHVRIAEYQLQYGGKQGMAANIVVPSLCFGREGPDDSGKRSLPEVTQEVIIGNPTDAARIARVHVKKQPSFTPLFWNSVISTTDNEDWGKQRSHLVSAFLPEGSLSKIFPVTLERAKFCATRLKEIADASPNGFVNMNDFLLYETEAQLQLALFGMRQEFMEETNEKFRQSMGGEIGPMYARQFCDRLIEEVNTVEASGPVTEGLGCPVRGPLSDAIRSFEGKGNALKGNAFIFAFAGHDTTGHTLTWLLFELAKNPEMQRKLQQEVDDFFAKLNGRDMTYKDLTDLKFMTRCVMETLRLWPAVANGTFREIQFDDSIVGPDGEDILLKKGTYCRINNWSRHRNPDLWGADVNTFNPDRDWAPEEIWHEEGLRGYNPSTERFSPFTFQPRDCIGKNFAHMEMRAILCYLLQSYSFELSPQAAGFDPIKFLGVNYGTMGPQDLSQPDMVKAIPGFGPAKRRPMGLLARPVPRK